mgnify:CR=1 FL=1|jgi:hypothetical protein
MVHETNLLFTTWQEPQLCNNVYGVLMSFILNKHITIFTDNDMYHANVATLGNRSLILNEHNQLYMESLILLHFKLFC